MEDNTTLRFIDKAISKTKERSLGWSRLGEQKNLLRERPDIIEAVNQDATIDSPLKLDVINYDESFYTRFGLGYIFLLLISNDVHWRRSSDVDPLDVTTHSISLRIQDFRSPYAKEIANSYEGSSEISVLLKRLYNLAEDSTLNLDGFINDFLNS